MQCVVCTLYIVHCTVHRTLYSEHSHIIKKVKFTKNFDCVGRGDLTSVFFSKVAKQIEVRGDLSSNVENKKRFTSRPSGL